MLAPGADPRIGVPSARRPSGRQTHNFASRPRVICVSKARGDLNRGTYTAQAGPVYIEPKLNPGAYDREVFLVLKEFLPSLSHDGDMAIEALVGAAVPALKQLGAAADAETRSKT